MCASRCRLEKKKKNTKLQLLQYHVDLMYLQLLDGVLALGGLPLHVGQLGAGPVLFGQRQLSLAWKQKNQQVREIKKKRTRSIHDPTGAAGHV